MVQRPGAGHGFYPVLLFRADGSGFYLSLSVATGRPFGTPNKSEIELISNRAQRFRPWFSSLGVLGLGAEPSLDLRIERGVGVGYRYGSVVHKFYDRALLPTESDLGHDVVALTKEYSEFCSRRDARDLYSELTVTEAELTGEKNQRYSRSGGTGQGFAGDSKIRRAVEQYAVDKAIAYFEGNGWSVDPSPQKNRPYDLLCKRATNILHVEVKGTVGTGEKVIITRGEANHTLGNPEQAVLFVVSDININRGSGSEPVLSGGAVRKLEPWNLDDTDLNPISYEFQVNTPSAKL